MDKQSQECLQRVRGKSMSSHTGHLKVGVTTVLQHEPKVIPISLQDLDGMKLIQNSLLVSPDYCFTRGLKEPEEVDKEDLRLYGGDVRGGVSVVTDGFTHGVMVAPVPGKNKSHVKFLAEQLIRYITERSFSTCTLKADGEPAMRLLLEVTQEARQKLGFKTMLEFSGPGDSQANGRVEREIQTVRGLARTLVRRLREGARIEINPTGPVFAWAMRHAGWLVTRFRRRAGSATSYEMVTRKGSTWANLPFSEKEFLAVFLQRMEKINSMWVPGWGRQAVQTSTPFEVDENHSSNACPPEALSKVRTWPWNVSYGQIGTKATPLLTNWSDLCGGQGHLAGRSGNRFELEWKPPHKILNYVWMRFHWRRQGILFLKDPEENYPSSTESEFVALVSGAADFFVCCDLETCGEGTGAAEGLRRQQRCGVHCFPSRRSWKDSPFGWAIAMDSAMPRSRFSTTSGGHSMESG